MAVTLLNTRPLGRAEKLNEYLNTKGIRVINIPLVATEAVPFGLHGSIPLEKYTGIFYSSLNGLSFFDKGVSASDKEKWRQKPVYTLSGVVKEKLLKRNTPPLFYSEENSLKGFIKEFADRNRDGEKDRESDGVWLHPCSTETRLNPEEFLQIGVQVENLPVYEPLIPPDAFSQLGNVYHEIDALLFTSGTGIKHFIQWTQNGNYPSVKKALEGKQLISLGASVSEVLQKEGIDHFEEITSKEWEKIPEIFQSNDKKGLEK